MIIWVQVIKSVHQSLKTLSYFRFYTLEQSLKLKPVKKNLTCLHPNYHMAALLSICKWTKLVWYSVWTFCIYIHKYTFIYCETVKCISVQFHPAAHDVIVSDEDSVYFFLWRWQMSKTHYHRNICTHARWSRKNSQNKVPCEEKLFQSAQTYFVLYLSVQVNWWTIIIFGLRMWTHRCMNLHTSMSLV